MTSWLTNHWQIAEVTARYAKDKSELEAKSVGSGSMDALWYEP
jgi:hypothetical protein